MGSRSWGFTPPLARRRPMVSPKGRQGKLRRSRLSWRTWNSRFQRVPSLRLLAAWDLERWCSIFIIICGFLTFVQFFGVRFYRHWLVRCEGRRWRTLIMIFYSWIVPRKLIYKISGYFRWVRGLCSSKYMASQRNSSGKHYFWPGTWRWPKVSTTPFFSPEDISWIMGCHPRLFIGAWPWNAS